MKYISFFRATLVAIMATVAVFSITSCSSGKEELSVVQEAMKIESSDQCHLCGMVISNFEGPKGQLALKGTQTSKFCSNRDMFSFYLQPENTHRAQKIYVHDMSKAAWGTPEEEYFIDAHDAWYVYGSMRKAAMGEALVSFSEKHTAEMFMKEYGGSMHQFGDITLELLNSTVAMPSEMVHDDSSEEHAMNHDEHMATGVHDEHTEQMEHDEGMDHDNM